MFSPGRSVVGSCARTLRSSNPGPDRPSPTRSPEVQPRLLIRTWYSTVRFRGDPPYPYPELGVQLSRGTVRPDCQTRPNSSARAMAPASDQRSRSTVRRGSRPASGSSCRHTSSLTRVTVGNVAMTCYIDQVRIGIVMAVLVLTVGLCLVSVIGTIERGRVSRYWGRAFARRHRLTVTVDNGNRVIRYLATTRRWRTVGLVVGLLVSFGWALSQGTVQVNFLTLFAGWFVGALVAEVRLARTSFGPRRAASLTARVPVMYLLRTACWLPPAFAVASVGGDVYRWVVAGSGDVTERS